MTFIAGLVIGMVLALIVIAFIAIDAYERGYRAAQIAPWRAELAARRRAERASAIAA